MPSRISQDEQVYRDHGACVRAVTSKDPRFDGLFITAVTSTGIYCRPSCPARTPHPDNMQFYPTAASAQRAGFRACKRCSPDGAPGSPQWDTRADAISRAIRLIHDGVANRGGVPAIAGALGYSTRQLQRLFMAELGASPADIARAHRAHTARTLLQHTDMPITEVAYAAGFASVRAFNHTMQTVYASTPTTLRGHDRAHHATNTPHTGAHSQPQTSSDICLNSPQLQIRLPVREPFDPSNLFGHLLACAIPGVEHWHDQAYRRTVVLPAGPAIIAVAPEEAALTVKLTLSDTRDVAPALARIARLADCDADPVAIATDLAPTTVGPLLKSAPGRRVPRTIDPHELVIRTVIGQHISTAAARTVTAHLVRAVGTPLADQHGLTHLFPSADAVAHADDSALPMPSARRDTVRAVASLLAQGTIDLSVGGDREAAATALGAVPGIGPWTVNTVLMRACADPDAFLPTDLGIKKAARALGLPDRPAALTAHAQSWRPWRSYATQYLWAATDHPINHMPTSEIVASKGSLP